MSNATEQPRLEWDEDGTAVRGTYPISTVSLGMYGGEDGGPIPTADTAVCDTCGRWASNVWNAGKTTTATDSLTDRRISRRVRVIVYACPEHSDSIAEALTDEWGSTTNIPVEDDLALAVDRVQRARFHDRA